MAFRTTTRIANRAHAPRKPMTEPEIMLWSRLEGRGCGSASRRCVLRGTADGVILRALEPIAQG